MNLSRPILATVAILSLSAFAQEPVSPVSSTSAPAADAVAKPDAAAKPDEPIDKRVFGVLPNYRTANASAEYQPLSVSRKFYIGLKDSTDYPVYGVAAAFAMLYQLEDSHPTFGQGMKGYAKRLGTSYADQAIGNMFTESIMPSLLHEDPRYFRRGTGSTSSRLGYAATRIFVTRTDAGGTRFNFSEVVGNTITAGIGNAYYRGERHWSDNAQRLYTSLATDAFSQVLKEFWPDVKRKFFKK